MSLKNKYHVSFLDSQNFLNKSNELVATNNNKRIN